MTAAGLLAIGKHKDAFEHVVTTVFGLPMDNNIRKVFVYNMGSEDVLDIYRLTRMAQIDMADLEFKPNEQAKATAPPPPKGAQILYHCLPGNILRVPEGEWLGMGETPHTHIWWLWQIQWRTPEPPPPPPCNACFQGAQSFGRIQERHQGWSCQHSDNQRY